MTKTNGDLKYKITDRLAVGIGLLLPDSDSLYDVSLTVEHPALSSQDFAALGATLVVVGFQKGWDDRKMAAMFASKVCDGDGVPSMGELPANTEFIVGVEYTSYKMPIGDKQVIIPRIKMTAYRPVLDEDGDLVPPDTEEMENKCRGVLELTIRHGTLVIKEHRGWLGSNEIVAYLRKTFEAAVVKPLRHRG